MSQIYTSHDQDPEPWSFINNTIDAWWIPKYYEKVGS